MVKILLIFAVVVVVLIVEFLALKAYYQICEKREVYKKEYDIYMPDYDSFYDALKITIILDLIVFGWVFFSIQNVIAIGAWAIAFVLIFTLRE